MINIFIRPRQSGKTTALIKTLEKNPNSILLVHNTHYKMQLQRIIEDDYGLVSSRIYTIQDFSRYYNNSTSRVESEFIQKITLVLIDEYLLFSENDKKKIYEFLVEKYHKEIISYTTSNKLYNRQDIEDMIKWKQINMSFKIKHRLGEHIMTPEFSELYHNLLTEPNCKVHEWNVANIMNYYDTQIQILGRIYEEKNNG